MSNQVHYSMFPSREIEEVYPYYNYQAFQDLTQQILAELMRRRKDGVKVVVKFYEEDTTP